MRVRQRTLCMRRRVMPSLVLDFMSGTFDPRITFARTNPGWHYNSAGLIVPASANIPRLDYDPATLLPRGFLVEEARANLKTYSQDIQTTNLYGLVNTTFTVTSVSTPISGLSTATLAALNVGANTGNSADGWTFGSGTSLTNSTTYTNSLLVKPSGVTTFRIRSNVSGLVADFLCTGSGTAPAASSDLLSASIQSLPDGWYRLSWTYTTTTSAPGNRGDYWALKASVADGVSGFYVTGAVIEAVSFPTSYIPTSYIPTTSAQVTRAADVATMTGTNFSDWYRQDEGTFVVEYLLGYSIPAGAFPTAFAATDGSDANRVLSFAYQSGGNKNNGTVTVGGTTQASLDSASTIVASSSITKNALAYKANDFAFSVNGVTPLTDASGTVPTVSSLGVGCKFSSNQLNGWIRKITYYPTRLSNAQLQALTA